jgi:hypothetical protein
MISVDQNLTDLIYRTRNDPDELPKANFEAVVKFESIDDSTAAFDFLNGSDNLTEARATFCKKNRPRHGRRKRGGARMRRGKGKSSSDDYFQDVHSVESECTENPQMSPFAQKAFFKDNTDEVHF